MTVQLVTMGYWGHNMVGIIPTGNTARYSVSDCDVSNDILTGMTFIEMVHSTHSYTEVIVALYIYLRYV